MIVLDASVVVELLLQTPIGRAVAGAIDDDRHGLHAPELLPVEVAQVLRRFVNVGAIEEERGRTALTDLTDLGIDLHGHEPLMARIWALRANLSAYDAAYVALAEGLGGRLVTADARLARAPGHDLDVELVT